MPRVHRSRSSPSEVTPCTEPRVRSSSVLPLRPQPPMNSTGGRPGWAAADSPVRKAASRGPEPRTLRRRGPSSPSACPNFVTPGPSAGRGGIRISVGSATPALSMAAKAA